MCAGRLARVPDCGLAEEFDWEGEVSLGVAVAAGLGDRVAGIDSSVVAETCVMSLECNVSNEAFIETLDSFNFDSFSTFCSERSKPDKSNSSIASI